MKAIRTDDSNLVLTMNDEKGEPIPDRNLPAQQILSYDPDRGQTEADAVPAIETTWVPDEGERRALANGAPVTLVVTGNAHPPVSMSVGEPSELEALISKAHADRAVGYWFTTLSKTLAETGEFPPAPEILERWHEALEETRSEQPLDLERELQDAEERVNGEGPE